MGATHDGNDIRINLFHIFDNTDGIVKCHCNRSQSDEIRLEIAYFGLKGFCFIRINNKIKQFYVYPGVFQYSGQKCQTQRRRRGFGNGVERVDQQKSHYTRSPTNKNRMVNKNGYPVRLYRFILLQKKGSEGNFGPL